MADVPSLHGSDPGASIPFPPRIECVIIIEPMTDHEPEIVIPGQARQPAEAVQHPARLLRIASMIRELLEDVRQSAPDEAGRQRLREIYERAREALKESLSDDLKQELESLTIPLGGSPSQSEIRVAQAQLVGWLEGLFQGIQAALWAQQMQARAQLDEMRRRGLPAGPGERGHGERGPGQYL